MESRVSIHHVSSDGQVWAEYLYQKLRAKEYEINSEQVTFNADSVNRAQSSILNVFFVTPDFLDTQDWSWTSSVDKNTCILVLTGTEHEDLESSAQFHKCEGVLDFYIYELKETEESVRDLLIFIITKYEDSDLTRTGSLPTPHRTRGNEPLHHTDSEPRHFKYSESKHAHRWVSEQVKSTVGEGKGISHARKHIKEEIGSDYDFLPKQQRQVNGVRDVIYHKDKLYLLLWRHAEGTLKVKIQDDEISPVSTQCAVYELPYEGRRSSNLSVIQDGTIIGEQFIQVPNSTNTEPTVIQSTQLPQSPTQSNACAQTSGVSVSTQTDVSEIHDGRSIISKCHDVNKPRDSLYVNIDDVDRESPDPCSEQKPEHSRKSRLEYIRKILEKETDPEEFLCQCLGIDKGVRHLDEKMTSMVQSVETLRHLSFSGRSTDTEEEESSAWPTLVHFGAQYNLLNFCDVLLSNPLMYGACVRKNKDGNMPHDIARNHGHNDLAEMLKHFSEFVRAEKERDSGISGLSSTPRLSTITTSGEPPPRPHRPSQFGDNYVDMSLGLSHEGYVNERGDEDLSKHNLKHIREVSTLSKDGGFCGSVDSDDDCLPMSPRSHVSRVPFCKDTVWESTRVSLDSSHSSVTVRDSSEVDPERSTIIGTDDECDPEIEHHRKDVVNMLGMSPPVFPDDDKKHKGSKLRKLFFGNKKRSKSEPMVLSGDVLIHNRNMSAGAGQRESTRSSSSTTSTYSDSSFREEDGSEVQMRGDKKHSGKKKIMGFLKTAKKRQSIRIKQVMEDNEIKAPALPSRSEVF